MTDSRRPVSRARRHNQVIFISSLLAIFLLCHSTNSVVLTPNNNNHRQLVNNSGLTNPSSSGHDVFLNDDDDEDEDTNEPEGHNRVTAASEVPIAPVELLSGPKDESEVPGEPTFSSKAKATSTSITIYWNPSTAKSSNDKTIYVRGFTIGWGIGFPDVHSRTVGKDSRSYTIESLRPTSEYVISLRAYNNMGDGPPALDTVKTLVQSVDVSTSGSSLTASSDPVVPILPPMGVKAIVMSQSTIYLQWTDTSLVRGQTTPSDNRLYIVKYTSNFRSHNPRYKYQNSTEPFLTIDDLKPNTAYEFSVKILKGRSESAWSMSVLNTTGESVPTSPPRDLTILDPDENDDPSSLNINWQPPKSSNGQISGYMIYYSTDDTRPEREWAVQAEQGDKMSATIRGLAPDTKYFFKIQSRTAKGSGPVSTPVSYRTPATPATPAGSRFFDGKSMSSQTLFMVIGIVTIITLIHFIILSILTCRSRRRKRSHSSSRHHHHNKKCSGSGSGSHSSSGSDSPSSPGRGLNPPDLWIHHEQLELKSLNRHGPDLSCDRDQSDLTPVLRTFQDVSSPLFTDTLMSSKAPSLHHHHSGMASYSTLSKKDRPSLLDFHSSQQQFNQHPNLTYNNPNHTPSSNDHGSTCSSSNYNTAFY